ncbi:MAG TPA: hypothetical protein PKM65_06035 [Spirochaetota bacterium]|nr:hypothetical protein [Spirochaetota bacterium]HNT10085.1 hypothetical protein [Spirochaetota bacterium]
MTDNLSCPRLTRKKKYAPSGKYGNGVFSIGLIRMLHRYQPVRYASARPRSTKKRVIDSAPGASLKAVIHGTKRRKE